MSDQISVTRIFQKTITLGNLIQVGVLIVGGIVGYNKLEWRITQLEQVKIETKSLIEKNYLDLRQSQTELTKELSRLSESVSRLVILEEVRQKNAK